MDPSSGDTLTLGDRSHVRRIVRMQDAATTPTPTAFEAHIDYWNHDFGKDRQRYSKKTLTGAPDELSEKVK